MEGAEVLQPDAWRLAELESQLRSLLINGEHDSVQADRIRDEIAKLDPDTFFHSQRANDED